MKNYLITFLKGILAGLSIGLGGFLYILMTFLFSGLTGQAYLEGVYSSIIGSNIGAIFTPIGALAGIMFSSLLNKYDIKFSFLSFIKYGSIISIPTLAISLLFLMIVL